MKYCRWRHRDDHDSVADDPDRGGQEEAEMLHHSPGVDPRLCITQCGVLVLHTEHRGGACNKHCITQGCLHAHCISQGCLHYTLYNKGVLVLNIASHRGACMHTASRRGVCITHRTTRGCLY
jgi:hypothetical protein